MSQAATAPVTFEVGYPESLSRIDLLAKSLLGWLYVWIPHGIILYVYGILAALVGFIGFIAILFTGVFPKGLFDFVVGYNRWYSRVYGYSLYLLTDKYPPFSPTAEHPVKVEVQWPARLSRKLALLKFFFGWLYVWVPHGIALLVYGVLAMIVLFLSWWAILITGRYPKGFFNFIVGFHRWSIRVTAYTSYLRDEYPPFSGRP